MKTLGRLVLVVSAALAPALPLHAQEPQLNQCPFAAEELDKVFGVAFTAVHPEGDLEMDGGVWLRSCRYESKTWQFRVVVNHYLKDPAKAKLERREFHAKDRVIPVANDADGAAFIETRDGSATPTLHYARQGVGVSLLILQPDLNPIKGPAALVKALQTKLVTVRRLP
jgi:hypothetical protein